MCDASCYCTQALQIVEAIGIGSAVVILVVILGCKWESLKESLKAVWAQVSLLTNPNPQNYEATWAINCCR